LVYQITHEVPKINLANQSLLGCVKNSLILTKDLLQNEISFDAREIFLIGNFKILRKITQGYYNP